MIRSLPELKSMAQDRVLDFHQVDSLAVDLDQCVPAPHECNTPIFQLISEISSMENPGSGL